MVMAYKIIMTVLMALLITSIVSCVMTAVAAQTPSTLVCDSNITIEKSGHRIFINAHNSRYMLSLKRTKKQKAQTLVQTADITVCSLPQGGLRVVCGNSVYIILTYKGVVSNS